MANVRTLTISRDEAGMRVDRWFKQRFPGLGHARLQKLLRTGQVRVDGGRVKSGVRLEQGQKVRVPPLRASGAKPERTAPSFSKADAKELKARILHRDKDVLVIDKPAGLAVQGGTKIHRNLDAMLDALRFDAPDKPRLVHRLDKDTSGVLVLARNPHAARKLTAAFRSKKVRKLYWAVVAGVPSPAEGTVDMPLAKSAAGGKEKVTARGPGGKKAVTHFQVIDKAGRKAAWVAFEPLTGRTHQLRVHALALETPILGDGKYGGRDAFLAGEDIDGKLHLHARTIRIPHPSNGILEVSAPLPDHMRKTFKALGFNARLENGFFT